MADSAQSLFQNFKVGPLAGVTRGQLVYLSDVDTIDLAQADALGTMFCMGIVEEAGAQDAWVSVLVSGIFEGFVHGGSGNEKAYVSAVAAGGVVTAEPASPNISQEIGETINVNDLIFKPSLIDLNKLKDTLHFDFTRTGSLPSIGTLIEGARIVKRAGVITNVDLYRRTAGAAGSTIVDVNKNGVTIFTTQGNRPTVLQSNGDDDVDNAIPDIVAVAAGDRIEVQLDAKEGGNAKDISVDIEIENDLA